MPVAAYYFYQMDVFIETNLSALAFKINVTRLASDEFRDSPEIGSTCPPQETSSYDGQVKILTTKNLTFVYA